MLTPRSSPKKSSLSQAGRTNQHSPLTFLVLSHWRALKASLKKVRQKIISSFITTFIIAITIALPAIFYIVLSNLQHLAGKWQNKPTISVYLKNNIAAEKISELVTSLKQQVNVVQVNYISPEQGLEDFKKFSEFSDVLPTLQSNPLPPLISVSFSHFDPEAAATKMLLTNLRNSTLVDQIHFDTAWIEKMQGVLSIAQRFILTLAILLAFGVVLVVSNTIRLITQSQQQEISVLKFIGATAGYIRRPFLYQGLCYGILGGALAWLVTNLTIAFIASPTLTLIGEQHAQTLYGNSIAIGVAVLIVAIALSLTGSWLAIQQCLYEQKA